MEVSTVVYEEGSYVDETFLVNSGVKFLLERTALVEKDKKGWRFNNRVRLIPTKVRDGKYVYQVQVLSLPLSTDSQ